jgi:hypothetical protein
MKMILKHPDADLIAWWQEFEDIEGQVGTLPAPLEEKLFTRYFELFSNMAHMEAQTPIGIAIQTAISGRPYVTGESSPSSNDERMYASAAKSAHRFLLKEIPVMNSNCLMHRGG